MMEQFAIVLVALTGPTGQRIEVNPAEVTSVREVRPDNKSFLAEGVHCVLGIVNGRFIAVHENCDVVSRKLKGEQAPCVLVCGGERG
jgi:hypothetical protein